MANKYVGPYSPEAYDAANIMSQGGAGTPYTAPIIQAGQNILSQQGGSVLGLQAPGGVGPGPTSGFLSTAGAAGPSQPGSSGVSEDAGFDESKRAEEERTAAELDSLNAQYDRSSELLSSQLSSLGTQKEQSIQGLSGAQEDYESQVGSARTGYETQTKTNISEALGTAKDVEKRTRNMLRGLGILSSSAAGELLQRPYTEFDKQRAGMVQDLSTRTKELDDALIRGKKDFVLKVKQLESNYADLVGQIQIDQRFNQRDKAAAIREAQASLTNRMSQIDTEQRNYQNEVAQYTDQLALEWSRLGYDPSRISSGTQAVSNTLTGTQQAAQPQQAGIYEDEERQGTFLSAY